MSRQRIPHEQGLNAGKSLVCSKAKNKAIQIWKDRVDSWLP